MLENIKIENFKGIKNATIEGFTQINVFIGKHGCGKSSLLDAIQLKVDSEGKQIHNENINKNKHDIVECLRYIEPKIKDFIYDDKTILFDIGKKYLPLNSMCSGIQNIIQILFDLYKHENTVLTIDDIFNSFHYSVISKLWSVIINIVIKNNIQLFITTHSYDVMKGLRDTALNKYNEDVATFTLLRSSDDELIAFRYCIESLDYSINQEIELR